jgi:glycine cleavage system H protein
MSETRYTKDHEYIRVEGDVGIVGITDFAQSQLGDVVFVELPQAGKIVAKGAEAAVVEGAPGLVNEDPAGKGWFLKMKITNKAELSELMDEAAYKAFVSSCS